MRLIDLASSRDNNFDFMRFVAASLVIVTHTFVLGGAGYEPFTLATGSHSFGTFAVNVFFIISGFLITKSWLDAPVLGAFLLKRFLRIFPALFAALLFAAFIVGPIVTTLPVGEYLSSRLTVSYLLNVTLYPIRNYLPGVFAANPYPGAVNGSLWTLAIEVIMYLSIAAAGIVGILGRRYVIPVVIAVLVIIDLVAASRAFGVRLPYQAHIFVKCAVFFNMGAALYLYREKVVLNRAVAGIALAAFIFSFKSPFFQYVSYAAVPYLVIYVAFLKAPFIGNFARRGDFSYGLYVYAFPVQQTLMHFWPGAMPLPLFFVFAFLVTLLLAFISWNLIERPSLDLKKRLPRPSRDVV